MTPYPVQMPTQGWKKQDLEFIAGFILYIPKLEVKGRKACKKRGINKIN